ncbi:basic amino acid/polyamine antiporter [Bordetella holmesii]|uniref:Transporter, basic amino acid/polyamine antiporter (APA) family n=2 Tax=Bordetella holmesii TaxID=35814 RepID=A0A158M9L1_9BORD|nr:basic amino acid/polyamine antiporter [Bordetella holmesii]AMD50163.1 arginine:agmatine antiporter [Bordetella holmesii F627]EXX94911.1 arginine/agmatine antiporter [Bordetella holmesii 1058]KAK80702.1 transporter, basic amino acid/polyamine antiporter (APA) family [Bordetella holmesii CDC-H809-BH]KAK81841.1 transporter, basic amino acid/polyamine antiporter (APA) family [Bordetella holmesii CDC-H572-BH]KAK85741.1 putative arginine/ornithine antiporter [Bordetella holmesii H620]
MTDKTQASTSTDASSGSAGAKLGMLALIAIVVGSMLGGGVYSLPQNTAATSAVGPVVIAWIIAGIGVYFIANAFRMLSDLRPDLHAGVYMYAQEGFGSFIGFNVAWGYWLMTCFGNVAFAVILMDAFDQIFPGVFTNGNNLNSIICGSILIWGYNYLVLSGTKVAGFVNTVGTIAKLVPLVAFVLLLGLLIDYSQLLDNVWGNAPQIMSGTGAAATPVSFTAQIMAPMTVTLWAFIGVEGAVVLSGRARNRSDVGKATLLGFLAALIIYILLSVLPFGAMTQPELAQVANPSTSGVLEHVVGAQWGSWLMDLGLIISVLAGWLAWTMLCAEIPMAAGQNGAFPKAFARTNKNEAATVSLWISSGVMQAAMLLVYFSNNAWNTMYNISALMVVPAYITTTLYMTKLCLTHEYKKYSNKGMTLGLTSGVMGVLFCLFILYASALNYLALVPVLLTCGLPVFIWSRKEKKDGKPMFVGLEKLYVAILLVADVIVFWLLYTGKITL